MVDMKIIMKCTIDFSVYKKIRKWYLEKDGKISCSHCHYHKGENAHRHPSRNWKKLRRHQYRAKEMA